MRMRGVPRKRGRAAAARLASLVSCARVEQPAPTIEYLLMSMSMRRAEIGLLILMIWPAPARPPSHARARAAAEVQSVQQKQTILLDYLERGWLDQTKLETPEWKYPAERPPRLGLVID
eukprot:scaffold10117_cov111-Isochrysis_galbana.AAC.6